MYIPQVAMKTKPTDFEVLDPGTTTRAIVVGIYHLGTIENEFEGKTTLRDSLFIEFELYRKKQDGTRFKLGRECGTGLGNPNPKRGQKTVLRRLATACFGKFDEEDFLPWHLLGKTCQIQTGLTAGGRMKIENYLSLDEDQAALKPEGKLVAWSILDPRCRDMDDSIPDFLLEKAKSCRELNQPSSAPAQAKLDKDMADKFGATRISGHAVNPDDDDAPF